MRTRLLALVLACLGLAAGEAEAAQARRTRPAPAPVVITSRLTRVLIRAITPAETEGYVRMVGTVEGVVDPKDAVVGLGGEARPYVSDFELIAPAPDRPANEVVYVDAENRGTPISWSRLGPDFLPAHATSYARVQWQTGIAKGVPADAQGIGLVIVRDFARWLAGRTPALAVDGGPAPKPYGKLILGGVSQSAWLVDTFVAEGFNADPQGKRIFDAAIAVDGLGHWLAINRIAADRGVEGQKPYIDPDGVPLTRAELLKRPATDPIFVDVANYTDFYRLRASLTSTTFSSPRFRRYDWPSPHAVGTAASILRCTGFSVRPNPVSYSPYMRALVLALEREIGVKAAAAAKRLPPGAVFQLVDAPEKSGLFNDLPGKVLQVPKTDLDGWPVGGVRFPDAVVPIGRPDPVAVPPVTTASIDATCGNMGGWRPIEPATLARRYGSARSYAARYRQQVMALAAQGYLLDEDAAAMTAPDGGLGTP